MNNKKVFLLSVILMLGVLCFFPIILNGQNTTSIFKDFNKDSFVDTLESYYDGGSGFGGRFVTLINGKTKEKFELNNYGCFCDIKHVILIPPELRKESNKSFLDVIKKELLPEKMNAPEASLQWLISAYISHKVLSNNVFYDLIINSPTIWIPGKMQLPKTYYVEVKGDTLHKLYFTESEFPELSNKKDNEGFLIYYGHNHFVNKKGDSLVMVNSTPLYKAYKTAHGVVLRKGDSYSWIFVTDAGLTGGPQKLRWESIDKVQIIDKYVIVQQKCPLVFPDNLFIIDIENGIAGRLKFKTSSNTLFKVDKENLLIDDNGKLNTFELAKLFNELSKNINK